MIKQRKKEIKKALYNYEEKKMLLNLYREKNRLKQLNENEISDYINLLNDIGYLEIGVSQLSYEIDDKIFEYLFIKKYSITRTALELNYSESGVIKRMNFILKKLDKYIKES